MVPVSKEEFCGIVSSNPVVIGVQGTTRTRPKGRVKDLGLDVLTTYELSNIIQLQGLPCGSVGSRHTKVSGPYPL